MPQSVQQQIDALRQEIDALKSRVEALEAARPKAPPTFDPQFGPGHGEDS